MTLNRFSSGSLITLLSSSLFVTAGCAGSNSGVKQPVIEVVYQASTDITDNGKEINGKLCNNDQAHFDISASDKAPGAIDLLGINRHFIIGRSSPTENHVVGVINNRGTLNVRNDRGASQEGRRAMLDSTAGGATGNGKQENEAVEFKYGPDHLVGRVGWHQFSVQAAGDHLEGQYQFNALNPVNVKIWGMNQLWALPLAEQGVLLPSLMHCLQKVSTHDFEMTLADLARKS